MTPATAARAPAIGAKTPEAAPVLGTAEAAAMATPLEAPVVLLAALVRARDRVADATAAVVTAPDIAVVLEEAAVSTASLALGRVAVLTAVVTNAGMDLLGQTETLARQNR